MTNWLQFDSSTQRERLKPQTNAGKYLCDNVTDLKATLIMQA